MSPEIKDSVRQTSPTTWTLGSLITCQKNGPTPTNIIATWPEGNEHWYLFPNTSKDVGDPSSGKDVNMIHAGGTSAAVWSIGASAICKAKSWAPGISSEANTIAFAKSKLPQVATPDVLHAWLDESMDRTFTIERRIEGSTLDEAWPSLSAAQKRTIATRVAQCCASLAQNTSPSFHALDNCAISEPFLGSRPFESPVPSWKPCLLPVMKYAEFARYAAKFFDGTYPFAEEEFVFYHADLGPTNIMVRGGELAGIIDWECAAYYPRWWVELKPQISAGFFLHRDVAKVRREWANMLVEELHQAGFGKPDVQFNRQEPAMT